MDTFNNTYRERVLLKWTHLLQGQNQAITNTQGGDMESSLASGPSAICPGIIGNGGLSQLQSRAAGSIRGRDKRRFSGRIDNYRFPLNP